MIIKKVNMKITTFIFFFERELQKEIDNLLNNKQRHTQATTYYDLDGKKNLKCQ